MKIGQNKFFWQGLATENSDLYASNLSLDCIYPSINNLKAINTFALGQEEV